MSQTLKNLLFIAAILLASYVLLFWRMDAVGLVGPDEPRFAQIAKEMSRSGDFITPRLMGKPWFEKPALYYWIAAASFKTFGISETAARFPSALAAALLLLAMWFWLREVLSARARMFSVVMLVSAAGFFTFARAASMDMLLTASFSAAMLLWLRHLGKSETAARSSKIPIGFFLLLGLSVLAKGPVGVAFVLLVGFAYSWCVQSTAPLQALLSLRGGMVLALVVLPWYVACTMVNGVEFLRVFLWEHNVQRFFTERYLHVQPLWFYFGVLPIGLFPWSACLLLPWQSLSTAWRERFRSGDARKKLFLWIWWLVPLVFYSLSKSKLPGYILPLFPPLAILFGTELDKILSAEQNFRRPAKLFVMTLVVELLILAYVGLAPIAPLARYKLGDLQPTLLWIAVGFAALTFFNLAWLRKGGVIPFVCFNAAFAVLGVWQATTQIFPLLDTVVSTREAARRVDARLAIDCWNAHRNVVYGFQYYLEREPQCLQQADELLQRAGPEPRLLVGKNLSQKLADFSFGLEIRTLYRWGDHEIYWYRSKPQAVIHP